METKEKYDLGFSEIVESLNKSQREAVETIEGPVMVIAGPGTGKTQMLAARIGKILQIPAMNPSNILCLTFTDAGRVEMQNRLFSHIGPAAYRVHIHTFHSFCNEVIQENQYYFSNRNLDPVSDLEMAELLQRLLEGLPPESPLKRFKDDLYYEIPKLIWLFSLMKRQAYTPSFLNDKINEYIESLPYREEYVYKRNTAKAKKGEPKQDAINNEIASMEKLKAAVNLFEPTAKGLHDMGRYTFDDMILWVITAFEGNTTMLLNYQERYQYVLVDEYQDTSGAQNKLLNLLLSFWEGNPNVFVVGDDDQSIYSFQDANIQNIRNFTTAYKKELKKIVLTENYRSTQPILNTAKTIIEHNKERIINDEPGMSKDLVCSNPKLESINTYPAIMEYTNSFSETVDIANQIENLLKDSVKPEEIAILYRYHRQAEDLAHWLQIKNIPFYLKKSINILDEPFIKKIIKILEYIDTESKNPMSGESILFEILHYDFFGLSSLDNAKLFSDSTISFRQVIKGKMEKYFSPEVAEKYNRVSNVLEGLIGKSFNITLQELFQEVIANEVLGYVRRSPEKLWLMELLKCAFDYIKEETRRNPELSLAGFLELIEKMKKNNLTIPLVKITGTGKGVNLLSAHGSKGTEFAHVFIIGCNAKEWEGKRKNSYREYKMPDNISGSFFRPDDNEEERRLFYVAVTRAKTNLTISYPSKEKDKLLSTSIFVNDLLSDYNLNVTKKQVDNEAVIDFMHYNLSRTGAPEIELLEKEFMDKLFENYTLSVTHLNKYLECPVKFYYESLLKIPTAKNAYMAFGTAIHETLRNLFVKIDPQSKKFPSINVMLDEFRRQMKRNRESFTEMEYKQRLDYGEKILPAYYSKYVSTWNKNVRVEKKIKNIEMNGIPLNGILDKIEIVNEAGIVNVVDYKTGSYNTGREKLRKPDDKNPIGGDYWRQAVFYRILLDNYPFENWKTASTEFDFIEPYHDEYKKEKVEITNEDIVTVKHQITDTWQKIQNRQFSTGCGECEWCVFLRENRHYVVLHNVEED